MVGAFLMPIFKESVSLENHIPEEIIDNGTESQISAGELEKTEITDKSAIDDEKEYMKLYFNDTEVPVIWEDNQTVQELIEEAGKIPFCLQWSEPEVRIWEMMWSAKDLAHLPPEQTSLPELIALFKESADIQTPDMLNLPVPEGSLWKHRQNLKLWSISLKPQGWK